ncbi:MAG: 16S rRNA (cytidine(1402)-2'-O)-methyltransferase [Ruminococcaceae bacterium]|nr:16S rRNA (cytidine(1402)-2'-O)-methyltransferase [Oscillospiraceae bacterium]
MGGMLYLVATPIGNLADLSERAVKVLSEVDFIAAEDTRNSRRLLSALGIGKEMLSYHDHNRRERGEEIARRLKTGESCALITDAGTPGISDPGEDMVALCAAEDIPVTLIPGPCAAINALVLSGLPTERFVFEGFLSAKASERRAALDELKGEKRTVIFHEAPHKLRAALADMCEAFGEDRRIALCRELTKLNEEIIRTTLGGACELYAEREPRGEFVLVVEGAKDAKEEKFFVCMTEREHVGHYISLGMSKNDAIKAAARDRGVHKSEIYKFMIEE